jgi:hypothetical protein|tara:strand:- start:450 stop:656 length:207 start_codon:yes stop_codon:yes gene_type:complete
MAIRKHAMTKEGAIVAITRNQIGLIDNKKVPTGIETNFIKFYMEYTDDRIQELYKEQFGIELVIVKNR